ncbi:hypothetical protein TNIN_13901 [Trichonephila inaurata madagascariensis]|uniref:Uncharacterized protein n=1 Tax=Trichonephila inaurata madagascariensis TaxID=2747483 RepID=A0A8X6YVA8_9ARAC|nr:hypothetical protein TNIN_13901 [Trichonephila inaurata madagascariensis]
MTQNVLLLLDRNGRNETGHQIFERSLKNHQGIPSHFQSGNEASNPRKGSAPLFLKENSKLTAKKRLPFPENFFSTPPSQLEKSPNDFLREVAQASSLSPL